MNNFIRLAFGLTTIFFIFVIILVLSGYLTFGYGLGDLFYLMSAGFGILVIAAVYRLTRKIDFSQRKVFAILIVFVLLFSVYYTIRLLTVDRGSEYSWNGHILFSPSQDDTINRRMLLKIEGELNAEGRNRADSLAEEYVSKCKIEKNEVKKNRMPG